MPNVIRMARDHASSPAVRGFVLALALAVSPTAWAQAPRVTAAAAGVLTVTPNPMAFGDVVVHTLSPKQTLVVTNTGSGPLTLGSPYVVGPGFTFVFTQPANPCADSQVLAAGASCNAAIVQAQPPSLGPIATGSEFFSDSGDVAWSATANGIDPLPVPTLAHGMAVAMALALALAAGLLLRRRL